ncbi:methyl-accepting chemotaxis protein [Aneurinibacillus sp. BA2021]|nr:methyl-accepting chemotaxis protein [Aneurinibacillus sp. BA2021]
MSEAEVGQLVLSFNNMISGLKQIIKTVSETSELVAASSEQLSTSAEQSSRAGENVSITIQELAKGSSRQLQSVEESTTVINEMAGCAEKITVNAEQVSHKVSETSDMSSEGKRSIEKVVQQMKCESLPNSQRRTTKAYPPRQKNNWFPWTKFQQPLSLWQKYLKSCSS